MSKQKEIKETIDVSEAIISINKCVDELETMQEAMDQYESLEFGQDEDQPTPSEVNSYCKLQSTRAGILNSIISVKLKLVAKIIPDASPEVQRETEDDFDAITAKDTIIERFGSIMQEPRRTEPTVKRLN